VYTNYAFVKCELKVCKFRVLINAVSTRLKTKYCVSWSLWLFIVKMIMMCLIPEIELLLLLSVCPELS